MNLRNLLFGWILRRTICWKLTRNCVDRVHRVDSVCTRQKNSMHGRTQRKTVRVWSPWARSRNCVAPSVWVCKIFQNFSTVWLTGSILVSSSAGQATACNQFLFPETRNKNFGSWEMNYWWWRILHVDPSVGEAAEDNTLRKWKQFLSGPQGKWAFRKLLHVPSNYLCRARYSVSRRK